jgi:hypothetical protein
MISSNKSVKYVIKHSKELKLKILIYSSKNILMYNITIKALLKKLRK